MNFLSFEKKLIPLDEWVQEFVDWLVFNHREIFQTLKMPIEWCLKSFEWFFTFLHPSVVIILFAVAAWRFAGKRVTVFTVVTFLLVGLLGLWEDTMVTLAMVFSSVIFCTIVGIPLGIGAGRSDNFDSILRPILDAMQTTPAFGSRAANTSSSGREGAPGLEGLFAVAARGARTRATIAAIPPRTPHHSRTTRRRSERSP